PLTSSEDGETNLPVQQLWRSCANLTGDRPAGNRQGARGVALSGRSLGWSLALIAGLLMFGTAMAAPTPAGTIISNQAQAVIDGQEVVPSNRVDTVVLEVCRGQFSPAGNTTTPGQRAAIVPPSAAYLS